MQRPARDERLIRHYLRAYRLVAIFVAVTKDGRTIFGHCRNLEAKLTELKAAHGAVNLRAVWCVADKEKAEQIIAAAPATAGAGPLIDALASAAARLRLSLTPHADVRARAAAGIETLRQRQQQHIRALNALYRDTRLDRNGRGLRTPPYNSFIARELLRLIYAEAQRFYGQAAPPPPGRARSARST